MFFDCGRNAVERGQKSRGSGLIKNICCCYLLMFSPRFGRIATTGANTNQLRYSAQLHTSEPLAHKWLNEAKTTKIMQRERSSNF